MPVLDAIPIPPLTEPPNWGRPPIAECGEPLITLSGADHPRLRLRPLYHELGIPAASPTLAVRAGVRDRLVRAAAVLPETVALVLFDGYRPLSVQQWLWDDAAARVRAERPDLPDAEIEEIVRGFVAPPVADPGAPPPHRTGGAADVYLVDVETGAPLPMGTEPDEGSPASATRHFEDHPTEPFTGNRRILFHAMIEAGFANYRGEWWHYDYGNQRWANCTGASGAIYGIAPEPTATPGAPRS
jgi:D-alanyl-D-alanine dipeptidase